MPYPPLPKTEQGLENAGYVYEGSGTCKGCGEEIAWYRTPTGNRIPLEEGTLTPHPTSCR